MSTPAPQWVRDRHMRLSTTPLGVVGAGWVLYAVGVLGAVYGFLFLPPRGWGMLQIAGAILLLLGVLVGVTELLGRSTCSKLAADLDKLPFPVDGYPRALGVHDADTARLQLTFAGEAPDVDTIVARLNASWLSALVDASSDLHTLTLTITGAHSQGTNWLLHQRVRRTINDVCVPLHELVNVSSVQISASVSSDCTSASDG